MITAHGIKKVVDRNRGYVNITSRAAMDNMVFFVSELLREAGEIYTSNEVLKFYYALEDMNVSEIIDVNIW